jgi:hypothetical protein
MRRAALIFTFALLMALPASLEAACVNKYVFRKDGSKVAVTLLTGKLTFQEAKDLAKAIAEKKSEPVAWVDASGKEIARQVDLNVVRPMPVGCDGRPSGSVLVVTFLRNVPPSGTLAVKLTPALTVTFEEQKN